MKYIVYLSFWALFSCLGCMGAADASELLQITTQKSGDTIVLSVPKSVPNKVFLVPDPDRLVVDVPALSGKYSVALPKHYKGSLIKAARYGQFDPQTTRFVFDLKQAAHVVTISEGNKKSPRLEIILAPGKAKEEAADSKLRKEKQPHFDLGTIVKVGPGKKSAKANKPDASERPLIAIDAGHGGVDPGAAGPGGAYEKDVVLAYAKALKEKLIKTGRYRVLLTRSDDRFIMLRKRVEIARQAGASIFISLHADSAPDDEARGLSVYTVSEKASDQEAEALAARENKSDIIAGMDLSDAREDVADILISLAQRETKNLSATLADYLVVKLDRQVRLLTNTHRFAGFAVLKAPDIPSVLIEIGFLSHPKEEKLLLSRAYREKVTAGIAEGVDAYFKQKASVEEP